MNSFLAALQLLTIFPVNKNISPSDRMNAVTYFPFIGLILGLAVASSNWLLHGFLPDLMASVMTIIILAIITGGLHLDGLADTADGFLSHKSKEQVLQIMKDSRIGSMGMLVSVLVILTKLSAIYSLQGQVRFNALLFAPVAGRCAIIWMMSRLGYARDTGLATGLEAGRKSILLAWITLSFLAVLCFHWQGILLMACWVGSVEVICRYSHKIINGYTGDTLGAICEISEAFCLVLLVSMCGRGDIG